jgi:hypothetical protein
VHAPKKALSDRDFWLQPLTLGRTGPSAPALRVRRVVPLDELGDWRGKELEVAFEVPPVPAIDWDDRLREPDHRPCRLGEAGRPAQPRLVIGVRPAPAQVEPARVLMHTELEK